MATKKILMVCMGNICRSPMAEGILRELVRQEGLNVTTDSAGTINHHAGEPPDRRAQACMRGHGIDISDLRARQVKPSDFHHFDLLLAMDADNLGDLRALAQGPAAEKAKLMMAYAPDHALHEVPDPYYGGEEGFEVVYRMLTEACTTLMNELRHG